MNRASTSTALFHCNSGGSFTGAGSGAAATATAGACSTVCTVTPGRHRPDYLSPPNTGSTKILFPYQSHVVIILNQPILGFFIFTYRRFEVKQRPTVGLRQWRINSNKALSPQINLILKSRLEPEATEKFPNNMEISEWRPRFDDIFGISSLEEEGDIYAYGWNMNKESEIIQSSTYSQYFNEHPEFELRKAGKPNPHRGFQGKFPHMWHKFKRHPNWGILRKCSDRVMHIDLFKTHGPLDLRASQRVQEKPNVQIGMTNNVSYGMEMRFEIPFNSNLGCKIKT
ncbi:hypothetical protein LXL04_001972 [Taraxacum kok-saghyz]